MGVGFSLVQIDPSLLFEAGQAVSVLDVVSQVGVGLGFIGALVALGFTLTPNPNVKTVVTTFVGSGAALLLSAGVATVDQSEYGAGLTEWLDETYEVSLVEGYGENDLLKGEVVFVTGGDGEREVVQLVRLDREVPMSEGEPVKAGDHFYLLDAETGEQVEVGVFD